MKTLHIFLVVVLMLMSCTGLLKSDDVKYFIPGTFLSTWKTEFSESTDTITIEPQIKHGSEAYAITRRTRTIFFNDGRRADPDYKIRNLTAYYDPERKTLLIENDGSILSFDIDKKEMKRGSIAYRKM